MPPEFPAFTRQNGAGDGAPTDSIEMIGAMQLPGEAYLDPEQVRNIVVGGLCPTDCVEVLNNTTNFEVGEVLVLYNDVPNEDATTSQWAMVEVISIIEDPFDPTFFALVELDYATHAAYSFHAGTVANAAPVAAGGFGGTPKLTRISVVRYFTQLDDPAAYSGPPPQLVMRSVDFAPAQPVGYLENFQIAYTIGIAAPVDQDDPPDPIQDLGAGVVLTAENMLSGVRITVTARSISAGLEGASEGADAGRADDFIRKTFSTNVNPRNLSAALEVRTMAAP